MIQSGAYNYLLFLLFYQTCLLLNGLFPFISTLCEEKLDCHYYVFQGTSSLSFCRFLGLCMTAVTKVISLVELMCFVVFTIWLKRLKECLSEVWEVTGAPLDSDLQQHLTQIIWSNAESPVSLLFTMKQNILCFMVYGSEQTINTKYWVR